MKHHISDEISRKARITAQHSSNCKMGGFRTLKLLPNQINRTKMETLANKCFGKIYFRHIRHQICILFKRGIAAFYSKHTIFSILYYTDTVSISNQQCYTPAASHSKCDILTPGESDSGLSAFRRAKNRVSPGSLPQKTINI